jgi:hypothetical protein
MYLRKYIIVYFGVKLRYGVNCRDKTELFEKIMKIFFPFHTEDGCIPKQHFCLFNLQKHTQQPFLLYLTYSKTCAKNALSIKYASCSLAFTFL